MKNENLFEKMGVSFLVESTKIECTTFPYKLPCQKPMFRQTESEVQNASSTKNRVFPVTTLSF